MKININLENIKKNVKKYNSEKQLLEDIKDMIYHLYTHNKNYNQLQWVIIQDLKDIFENIEIIESESTKNESN